jgi:DNA-binding XRE family transcriptional regulator
LRSSFACEQIDGSFGSGRKNSKWPLRDVLAKKMRRLRAARSLSQEALAHECGINRTYLSGVERSERNVSDAGGHIRIPFDSAGRALSRRQQISLVLYRNL